MATSEGSVTLCRLMNPNDANTSGNVHGGTILKMIEEAGMIVSTRFCNHSQGQEYVAGNEAVCALVRVERTDFFQPMYVGEIAHLTARVSFCSDHSVEVKVDVSAENLFKGEKRLTNRATLWYVPVKRENIVCRVPPLAYASVEDQAAAKQRYSLQKQDRLANNDATTMSDDWLSSLDTPTPSGDTHTVSKAQSTLIHLVGVQDCGVHERVTGGVTMKLMDEVAGICAARHCRTNIVTASLDTVDFHKSITKGSLLHIRGRPIFSSHKSLLIQVVVMVESGTRQASSSPLYMACTAFFTYVSLSPERTTLPIPPLKLQSDSEHARFEEGRARYEKHKAARKASAGAPQRS